MIELPEILLAVPSYRRPGNVETLKLLPSATVFVAEAEGDAYRAANPLANIVTVPNEVQGNLCRVRNWIMDEAAAAGVILCIVDDDMQGFGYWKNGAGMMEGARSKRSKKAAEVMLDEAGLYSMIERYSLVAMELGVYLWGVNVNPDPLNYREYTPFSFTAYIGGPFQVHMPGSPLRFDESLPLKEDYDFFLQHLNKYRKCLRVNKYFYRVRQAEQAGGCATYRSLREEIKQFGLLQAKWGSEIVQSDARRKGLTKKGKQSNLEFDINPVIHAPIKGV